MDASRVLLYDRNGFALGELSRNDQMERTRREALNGERSLTLRTMRVLEKGTRVLTCDARGKWREYVVAGVDEQHAEGARAVGTYWCDWSLKQDLMGTTVSKMPGVQTPVTASEALAAALSGTARWKRGRVALSATGGASMYDMSGWEALGVLVSEWGGEVEARIEVDSSGVVSRWVDLSAKLGEQDASRRFDYGRDLKGITRSLPDDPFYCRISPRGKGEPTEGGGFGRKVRISDANGGVDYLQDDEAAAAFRFPDGMGGWEYPTVIVENAEIDDAAELKAWGDSVLRGYTRPKATYTVDVVQNHEEGADPLGVSLGDAAHVVDRAFGGDGLRIEARVVELEVDELDAKRVTAVIGEPRQGISDLLGGYAKSIRNDIANLAASAGGTADFLDNILDNLNEIINATGGYTYITEGQGLRTYDKAVSDPLVGSEADAVVEMKGGTIRIASSRTASGDWEWRTVFTSGHIAADMVTAANITAGYIGSASGGNFWNLDTGEFRLANTATLEGTGKTVKGYVDGSVDALDKSLDQSEVFDRLTNDGQAQGIYLSNGLLYVNGTYVRAGTIANNSNKTTINLDNGAASFYDAGSNPTVGLVLQDGTIRGYRRYTVNGVEDFYQVGTINTTESRQYIGGSTGAGLGISAQSVTVDGSEIILDGNGLYATDARGGSLWAAAQADIPSYDLASVTQEVGKATLALEKRDLVFEKGLLKSEGHEVDAAKTLDVSLDGHSHSGYAASNHTHAYASISGAPTFQLAGSVLTITV